MRELQDERKRIDETDSRIFHGGSIACTGNWWPGLMAASALLVTISQAWANRPATRDAFDAHVNGVAHFLTAMLEEAT